MSIKALQEYTRFSKYSRFVPELKRRETWEEQVDRVFKMHEQKYPEKIESIREDFEFAKQMVKRKRVLGSQRALQFGGKPILDKNAKLYNCTVSYVDRPRFFQECMYLLLCGCGTGFSVQKQHIAKLSAFKAREGATKTYVIPDSIEGWADAVGVLVSSYFTGEVPFPEFQGHKVSFDFSQIRPAGAPLSWGGKAPGAKGLIQALKKIENVFESTIVNSTKLRPIDAYDIIMHASDAVLSGGIRRSATICIFSADDTEMANAKTGDWFIKNPQRGRSNNSALLIREKTSKEDFERLMKSVREFGEPGFIWSDNEDALYNPCLDGDTLVSTDKGEVSIRDIVNSPIGTYKALSYDESGNLVYNDITAGIKTKENTNTIKIEFDDETCLQLTPDHLVFTENRGYVKASLLTPEDEIVSVETSSDDSTYKTTEVTESKYVDQSQWVNRVIKEEKYS